VSRTLSTTAVASQNAENTDQVWLTAVTIAHDSLAEPIRVVDNTENIISNGNIFVAWDFTLQLPGEDPDNPVSASISIGNIDPEIIKSLRAISSPPTVTIQILLGDSPDVIEIEFSGLILRNATYDANQITGELRFEELLTEPIATTLTPAMFPGMF